MADPRPLRIEFVCTANISRSPYAERTAASMSDPALVRFRSSGIQASEGAPMDPQMVAELRKRGVAPGRHVSRPLSDVRVTGADLVLTMEASHRQHILDYWPESVRKTFTFAQFVVALADLPRRLHGRDAIEAAFDSRSAVDPRDDVIDPYRRGPEIAAVAAERLDDLAWELVRGLKLAHGPRRAIW